MRCRLVAPADAQLRQLRQVPALDVPHAQVQLGLSETHVLGGHVRDGTGDTPDVVGEDSARCRYVHRPPPTVRRASKESGGAELKAPALPLLSLTCKLSSSRDSTIETSSGRVLAFRHCLQTMSPLETFWEYLFSFQLLQCGQMYCVNTVDPSVLLPCPLAAST
eukprot:764850-Hanusia_phi.AAC.6